MKKKAVCIVTVLLIFTTISVTVQPNSTATLRTIPASRESGVWLHHNSTVPSSIDNYLHYDDGTCEDAVGWAKGDRNIPLYEVIKFTPTELRGLHGAFDKIKIMHGCPTQPDGFCDKENYTVWIYTDVNPPPSPTENTTMIASGFCEVINDFFYFNLTNPYPFTENDTVWIGVGWDARVGTYPGGFDKNRAHLQRVT